MKNFRNLSLSTYEAKDVCREDEIRVNKIYRPQYFPPLRPHQLPCLPRIPLCANLRPQIGKTVTP